MIRSGSRPPPFLSLERTRMARKEPSPSTFQLKRGMISVTGNWLQWLLTDMLYFASSAIIWRWLPSSPNNHRFRASRLWQYLTSMCAARCDRHLLNVLYYLNWREWLWLKPYWPTFTEARQRTVRLYERHVVGGVVIPYGGSRRLLTSDAAIPIWLYLSTKGCDDYELTGRIEISVCGPPRTDRYSTDPRVLKESVSKMMAHI